MKVKRVASAREGLKGYAPFSNGRSARNNNGEIEVRGGEVVVE